MSLKPINVQIYHVFLASPGDVNAEREHVRRFFDDYNRHTAHLWNAEFRVIDWENYATIGVGRPQELITKQTLEKFKGSLALMVGLMAQRFGSPTGMAESGTQEEFNWAKECHDKTDFPEIKWYFRKIDKLELPTDLGEAHKTLDQWEQVQTFRKQMQDLNDPIFYTEYPGADGFARVFDHDLNLWLNDPARPWAKEIPASADFNVVIDVAAAFLKEQKPDVAIERLKEIERHHWTKLDERQRYRVYANLGHAYTQKDLQKKASECFLKAAIHQPSDEVALGYKAQALLILNQVDEARQFAETVIDSHPTSSLAHSVVIRTDSSAITTCELKQSVPESVVDTIYVLYALYCRAIDRDEILFAEDCARELLQHEEKNLSYNLYLASALTKKAVHARQGLIVIDVAERETALHEAIDLLSALIGERNAPYLETIATARAHRAVAYSLLEENDRAEADFREAVRLLPNDQGVRHQFAIHLCRADKPNDAINVLTESESRDEVGTSLFLARMLTSRGALGDNASAIRILKSMKSEFESLPPKEKFEFAQILCTSYAKADEPASAKEFLDTHAAQFSVTCVETLRAILSWDVEDRESAITHAALAAKAIDTATPDFVGWFLGELLAGMGEFEKALNVFKRFIMPSGFHVAVHRAIDCARQVEDYQFIFDLCRSLRYAGNATPFTVETEIAALEQHSDFNSSVAIIDDYLLDAKDPEFAKSLRVRKSLVGLRLDRHEWIETNVEMLPSPQTVSSAFGCVVASMLVRSGQFEAAARYAYELFRRHSDAANVHKCIGTLFGIGNSAEFKFPEPQIVGLGSAVRFKADGSELEQWLVIEDEYAPRSTLNEIAPESDLAAELFGKSVGDEFFYRRNPVQDLKGQITGLVHKYEFRRFDCLYNFEKRFPDDFFCISLQVPKKPDGDLDFATFFETLKKVGEPIKKLDQFAKSKPISPAQYSVLSGRSIIETVLHFGASDEIPIRCCNGTDEEFGRAETVLNGGLSLVADPTALATMFTLGVHEELAKLPYRIFVSEATIDLFRQIARDSSSLESEWFEGIVSGKIHRVDDRRMSQSDLTEHATSFYKWLEQNCDVRSGLGKVKIPVNRRKELTRMFGEAHVESIGLAAAEAATLWTDDIAVSELSIGSLVSDRVWTDTVLEHLQKLNLMSAETLIRAKLCLIGCGYTFTRMTFPAAEFAMREAKWSPAEWPLRSVLDWLHRSGVQPLGALQHALHILRKSWLLAPLAHQPRDLTKAVVRALSVRVDGGEILRLLERSLSFVFESNPIAADFCRSSIHFQLSLSGPDRLLILPGDPGWLV